MANYLKLFDKTSKEDTHLVLVDARICKEVYHKEPHEVYWGAQVFNWYDTVGFQLSTGKNMEQVREYFTASDIWTEELPMILPVIEFLENNYTPHARWSW